MPPLSMAARWHLTYISGTRSLVENGAAVTCPQDLPMASSLHIPWHLTQTPITGPTLANILNFILHYRHLKIMLLTTWPCRSQLLWYVVIIRDNENENENSYDSGIRPLKISGEGPGTLEKLSYYITDEDLGPCRQCYTRNLWIL